MTEDKKYKKIEDSKGIEEILSEVYLEEVKNELDKEVKEKEYLPQENFPNCSTRAAAITGKAKLRTDRILALAIIEHREKKHSEDYKAEKEALKAKMSEEDIESASTYSWWRN